MHYTEEQLQRMLEAAGGTPPNNQAEDVGSQPVGGHPSLVQIMGEVQTQGIQIPFAQIGAFLWCVLSGIMTKPLPLAVMTCAGLPVPGGTGTVSGS